MARRDSSAAGCGFFFLVLCVFPVAVTIVAVPAFVLAAPTVAAYLQIEAPAQFGPHRTGWLAASAAAPLLALLLVWLASPRTGRLRGRSRECGDAGGLGGLGGARERSGKAILRGYLVRAGILIGGTTATALAVMLRVDLLHLMNSGAHGQRVDIGKFLAVYGSPAAVATLILLGIRRWDRRPYPIHAERVRAAAQQARQTLRQVRADNKRLSRLAREVQAKLVAARSETDFVALRNLHYESFSCADTAHGHYRSAQYSLQVTARILDRVRAAPRRWLPPASRAQAHRSRQDRELLNAAASALDDTRGQLSVEVQRGLSLVQTLNANTAELKHSIRSDCGEPGRLWYEALEQRIEATHGDGRHPARAGL
jgi:hypothetical protein